MYVLKPGAERSRDLPPQTQVRMAPRRSPKAAAMESTDAVPAAGTAVVSGQPAPGRGRRPKRQRADEGLGTVEHVRVRARLAGAAHMAPSQS